MDGRNYGFQNFNNRAFSPPRMNQMVNQSGGGGGFAGQSKQFFGGHASQPFFQYQNANMPQPHFEGNFNSGRRQSRFDDYPPRNHQQDFPDRNFFGFVERPAQNFNDRPAQNFNDRPSNNNRPPQQRLDRGPHNSQRPQTSHYDSNRSNFNEQRGPPRSSPPNHPQHTSTATSSQQNNSLRPLYKLKFNDIFTVSRRNEDGVTTYNCKLCKLTNLPENNLQTHVTGKRHKHHVKLMEGAKSTGVVNAGGSGKVVKMTQFKPTGNKLYTHQPMFDSIISEVQHPLIALTYTVEILDQTLKEPSYVCVLCSKRCDPRTVINHLVSQTHRMNYLERHFPRLITILHNNRRFNEDMQFRQLVLINVAKVLEETFGRSSAFVYDGNDYETTKEIIFDNINKRKHIAQGDIPNDEGLLEGINLDSPTWDATHPPKAPVISVDQGRKRRLTDKAIEDYRSEVHAATQDLEKKLENYQSDPESHPFYRKEWELFWNRKVDEVTARGGDPQNCNFHSEWCGFFLERMKELHRQEVKWKVEQLRRKFAITPADVLEMESSGKKSRPEDGGQNYFSDRKGRFNNDFSDDSDDDEEYTIDTPRIAKDELYVKEKKIFDEFLTTLKPVERPAKPQQPTAVTLITTLRLLSSLEAELGLLAPKVLDLLSRSLAFERENPKRSDDLLFDSENLNLVETVKEKILGMQAADLIAANKRSAAQKAIGDIESLIERHEAMVKVKASLRTMGKTDASAEEIEMLLGMMRKDSDGSGSQERDLDREQELIEKRKRMRRAVDKLKRQDNDEI